MSDGMRTSDWEVPLFNRHLGETMTRIRATCPDCGNVEFGIQRIVVVGQAAPHSDMTERSEEASSVYRFNCPTCDRPVHRSADREIIDLLISVGVHVESTLLLPEPQDRLSVAMPVLTHQDVDNFRTALNTPGWLEQLIGNGPTSDREP